jgi:hypothetical protein
MADLDFSIFANVLSPEECDSLAKTLAAGAYAQTGNDACHVYLVDVAKAKRALESYRQTGNEELDEKAL